MPESFHSDLLNLFSAISHIATLEVGWLSGAARSSDVLPMELERSSPPSHQEVHEPLHNWDAAPDPHSVPGGEVSWLALCLDAVQTALSALEWEIADAWAATADAQAKTIGKVSFIEKLYPTIHGLVLTVFSVVSPGGGVCPSSRSGPHHRQRRECRGCPA